MVKKAPLTIGFMSLYFIFSVATIVMFGLNLFTVVFSFFALMLLAVVIFATIKADK